MATSHRGPDDRLVEQGDLVDHGDLAEDHDLAEDEDEDEPGPSAAAGTAAAEDPDVLILTPDGAESERMAAEPGLAAETPGLVTETPDLVTETAGPGAMATGVTVMAETPGTAAGVADTVPEDAFAADLPPTNPDYRWREIQAMFVDDPRGSVERAADMAHDTLRDLTSLLEERERSLRSTWQDTSTDTEQLRTSLRSYRALVNRVTELSQPS